VKEQASVDPAQVFERVDISNARAAEIPFELRLFLSAGARVIHADHALAFKNGRPIFRLNVPAGETVILRFQVEDAIRRSVVR
jgi:hypothetical protein